MDIYKIIRNVKFSKVFAKDADYFALIWTFEKYLIMNYC